MHVFHLMWLVVSSVLVETSGKLPHEQEAATAAADEAARAEAAAAALHDIPGANAQWVDVVRLMDKARQDMDACNMTDWLANGMQRARAVDTLCGSWIVHAAGTAEQKQILNSFWTRWKLECSVECKGDARAQYAGFETGKGGGGWGGGAARLLM